ncbi:hypothetical protein K6L09_21180 [Burkholderia cepacia]
MEENNDDIQMPLSPTLQALKAYGNRLKVDLPPDSIICSHCPKALWHLSTNSQGQDLKNFCRVMHVMVWTSEQPGDIVLCDGAVEKDDNK